MSVFFGGRLQTTQKWLCVLSDHWLWSQRLMCFSKLKNFMATLVDGYQFQGLSQGENAPISRRFWWKDKFHTLSSQEAQKLSQTRRKQSSIAAALEMPSKEAVSFRLEMMPELTGYIPQYHLCRWIEPLLSCTFLFKTLPFSYEPRYIFMSSYVSGHQQKLISPSIIFHILLNSRSTSLLCRWQSSSMCYQRSNKSPSLTFKNPQRWFCTPCSGWPCWSKVWQAVLHSMCDQWREAGDSGRRVVPLSPWGTYFRTSTYLCPGSWFSSVTISRWDGVQLNKDFMFFRPEDPERW